MLDSGTPKYTEPQSRGRGTGVTNTKKHLWTASSSCFLSRMTWWSDCAYIIGPSGLPGSWQSFLITARGSPVPLQTAFLFSHCHLVMLRILGEIYFLFESWGLCRLGVYEKKKKNPNSDSLSNYWNYIGVIPFIQQIVIEYLLETVHVSASRHML